MFDLCERTALVTGAGKGMGLGIAEALASRRAKSTAEQIGGTAVAGDITNGGIRTSIASTIGKVDILVNNAGVPEGMSNSLAHADKLTETDYQRQMNLNHHAVRGL